MTIQNVMGWRPLVVLSIFWLSLAGVRADAPAPTLEQRVAGLEAYLGNGDPTGALKDEKGTIPDGLTTASVGVAGPGHNAWMMTSAALVLFMTLPGLALFYGGLVRSKNVLSILAQCLGITGLVTILWWAVGYSLVFDDGFKSPILGGLGFTFLKGVTSAPNTNYAYWVSQNVFSMYQMMFAIITPALIIGAIAERIKFSALLLFVGAWMFIVYFPLAHMVWGINGLMNGVWNAGAAIKAVDFAGGTVVHMSSGWSALVLCMILGKRLGFGKEPMPPHSMVLCMVGTGMLWVGWYGFNAGSAVAADGVAANAFMTTTSRNGRGRLCLGGGGIFRQGEGERPRLLLGGGRRSGGGDSRRRLHRPPPARSSSGSLAGLVPWFFCTRVKRWFGYDDALDTFGMHAVGGTLGAFLTGVLATVDVNANLALNLKDIVGKTLVAEQCKAIALTLVLSVVGTAVIASCHQGI